MGRGYIRQRKRATTTTWEVRVYAGQDPETGKKRWVSKTVRTSKRDAQRVLTKLLSEVDAGSHSGPDATMADLFQRWQEANRPKWSPSTVDAYAIYIRRHLVPGLGSVLVRHVRSADLDAFYGRLLVEGLSGSSVAKCHGIVHRALAQAVRWGWVPVNVADAASPPRAETPDLAPPDPEQVRRMLAAVVERQPMFATFLAVAAATGARRGEVCALRWSDLQLGDEPSVTIGRALVHGQHQIHERATKTRRVRRVALDPATAAVLAAHKRRCKEAAFACGVRLAPDAFLFSTDPAFQIAWRPDGVTQRFSRLRAQLGIEGVRLHDLRHLVATYLLSSGVDVRTVAGRLGHARASTTLDVYSHFMPAADRAAAELLGKMLEAETR